MKKVFQVSLILILFLTALFLSRNIYLQVKKFQEISSVEKKAARLEELNKQLKAKLEKANDPISLEKQARDKLGYQREGDVLYVVKLSGENGQEKEDKTAIWKRWFNLFYP